MEMDKFIITEDNNMTIGCAALSPFPEDQSGEMACVAVHPDYRNASHGDTLLERIRLQGQGR